jgi:hypothetical protein
MFIPVGDFDYSNQEHAKENAIIMNMLNFVDLGKGADRYNEDVELQGTVHWYPKEVKKRVSSQLVLFY